jgi:hypothetical protein
MLKSSKQLSNSLKRAETGFVLAVMDDVLCELLPFILLLLNMNQLPEKQNLGQ